MCATFERRRGPNARKATACIPLWQGVRALGGVEDLSMSRHILRGNRESLGVSAMEQSTVVEQSSAERVGKVMTDADDVRAQAVGPLRSTEEAREQTGASRGGVRGGKAAAQGQ